MNYSQLKFWLLGFFTLAVIFTRFYNLDHTARFTQDESSDLARMHDYFNQRKITLVGPISNDNSKVFSSITYYMLMPFAAASDFTPLGPVYGTAFFGVITAFLMLAIIYKLRPEWTIAGGVLLIVWYPLLTMSRWAWNPHLLLFWGSLGVLGYLYRQRLKSAGYFLTGLSFGLMFHHHYLAILATGPIILYLSYQLLREKKYPELISLMGSYFLAHLPFVLFDLRHPPGLFFGKYLLGGNPPDVKTKLDITGMVINFWRNYLVFTDSLTKPMILRLALGILVPFLAFLDLKSKKLSPLVWLVPTMAELLAGVILVDYQVRYLYPSLIFLLVWLLIKRRPHLAQQTANLIMGIIILGSLLTVYSQLTTTLVPPDMYSLMKVDDYISQTIKQEKVVNPNIAVVMSPDSAPLAEKYRDLLSIKGIQFRAASEYELSENLFAITTAESENDLRADKSFAIQAFEKAHLKGQFAVPNSPWKVYYLGY